MGIHIILIAKDEALVCGQTTNMKNLYELAQAMKEIFRPFRKKKKRIVCDTLNC